MPTKSKISLITFFLASILSFAVNAATIDQNLQNQQDRLIRDQQKEMEIETRRKEFQTIKKERLERQKEEREKNKENAPQGKIAKCFLIKEIKLNNAKLLSKKEKQQLTKPFLGRCFDNRLSFDLTNGINNYYKEKGYITVNSVPVLKNIADGVLEINVVEGKIEKIIIDKNKEDKTSWFHRLTNKTQKLTAFGNIEGKNLNLNNIDQGVYQINRLPSNSVIAKIENGDNAGESVVVIDGQKKFPARVNAGYDNLGNEFTGVRRNIFGASFDNLLFLNDNINLNYTTNLRDDNHKKDLEAFSSGISIPYSYNTFSFDYSRTNFAGITDNLNIPKKYTGFSDQRKFAIDRVLFRKNNLRISGNTSLIVKNSANYIDYDKQPSSDRKLTIGGVSFAVSNYFKNGVSLYLKPSYSRGLKLLNAQKDEQGLPTKAERAQFSSYKLYASVAKQFVIPKINLPVTLSSEMDSQVSEYTLFGSERFSVGGYYSVRGFQEDYISGDNGYYFRNKAAVNLGSIVAAALPQNILENTTNPNSNFFVRNLYHLNKIRLEPFYDYGFISNKANSDKGRLSGAGIKTIFEQQYFNASVTYGKALSRSQYISSDSKKENQMVYFELGMSCC